MSTYYEYRDVKVMIAHKLMNMKGWKVYGYHADESDSMTDYYDPASWDGVAEKNGYILCVNVYGAAKEYEIKQYTNIGVVDRSIYEKINKLQELTTERGATEGEAATAQKMLEKLKNKLSEQEEQAKQYIITGKIPGHMANPPRMNWHIEKDGVYIAKGNGILKYASIEKYYNYSGYVEDMEDFKTMSKEEYIKDYVIHTMHRWNESEERATESANSHYETLTEDAKLIEKFEAFINKIDTTCGGMIGDAEQETYEKIKVTEYKTENKAVEDGIGSIKEGQCFIVKSSTFNSGIHKGLVYRIHERECNGHIYYDAYKLNGKLTKECHGMASRNNNWNIYEKDGTYYKKFLGWFESGKLAWCHIEEVKTPYEVEKIVKKTIKAEKKNTTTETAETATEEINVNNYKYEVSEDTDTRDNSKIYLVKVAEKLSREEYIQVNKYIKSLGGYYSKFKHAFLFKENPADKLNVARAAETTEPTETESTAKHTEDSQKAMPKYNITEDKHTKTGAVIWVVTFDNQLSKTDFAEVKRKFATLKGYYSSFKKGFIFSYDPSEALKTA